MAETDTRPLESVQAALNLFEQRSDQSRFSSPDRNEQEIDIVKLESCKLQLEVRENENKQANMKLEAQEKATQELPEKHDRACLDAHNGTTELETDNGTITSQQSETASECKALRDVLAVVRGELDAVKGANAYVLGEVESMETKRIMESEHTREALTRILELNDAVLSSAVAAIRAEEERSVFFQEVTVELFSSDKNLEAIRRQKERMESMEEELLAKTLEIVYLRSELKQAKELYVSSERAMVPDSTVCRGDAEPADTGRSGDEDVNAGEPENGQGNQEPRGELAYLVDSTACNGSPEVADTYFDTELPIEDLQNIQSDDGNINHAMCENAIEGREEPKIGVCFATESSREDFKSVNSGDQDMNTGMTEDLAGNSEPQEESAAPTSAVCRGDTEAADTGFSTEIVTGISKDDDVGEGFYTKETGDAGKLEHGYVLVDAKKAAAGDRDALNDGKLDAAHAEISDLRFSLEEAVRRAELAEESKAALERELREEIRKKQRPRAPSTEDVRPAARDGNALAPPARPRSTPSRRSAPRGGDARPPPRCLTLGKVLNMRYK